MGERKRGERDSKYNRERIAWRDYGIPSKQTLNFYKYFYKITKLLVKFVSKHFGLLTVTYGVTLTTFQAMKYAYLTSNLIE